MIARELEDLLVFQKALAASDEVSVILERPTLRKDYNLCDQLSRSSERVAPLIAEGWGQLTDRHVATYLGRARGSAYETRVHLRRAFKNQHISQQELIALAGIYEEISMMLTSWINYLEESNWKSRARRRQPERKNRRRGPSGAPPGD